VILYLDTSALVKLYAREPGSRQVSDAVARAGQIATSLIAYVETRAALARKHRIGEIDGAALRLHKWEFERDWRRLHRLPVDAPTVRRAGEIAEQHHLRAYDALHLATADLLRAAIHSPVTFACADTVLSAAAVRIGMTRIPGV
jgi:uncharacterized protein